MAVEVEPVELAQLLDTAERPRTERWSLRAALTRYAQPQPQRGSAVIELVRRIESALRPHQKLLERKGAAIWAAVVGSGPESGDDAGGVDPFVVQVLQAMREIDRLGDVLAAWAVAREGERPDQLVDEVVADVTRRLEDLGVQREERPPSPGARRG